MKRQLPLETICRAIQLLKFSDLSYRAIAADAGCSTAFVAQIFQGKLPCRFVDHLRKHGEELLDTSMGCPHCGGRVPLRDLQRGQRLADHLAECLQSSRPSPCDGALEPAAT